MQSFSAARRGWSSIGAFLSAAVRLRPRRRSPSACHAADHVVPGAASCRLLVRARRGRTSSEPCTSSGDHRGLVERQVIGAGREKYVWGRGVDGRTHGGRSNARFRLNPRGSASSTFWVSRSSAEASFHGSCEAGRLLGSPPTGRLRGSSAPSRERVLRNVLHRQGRCGLGGRRPPASSVWRQIARSHAAHSSTPFVGRRTDRPRPRRIAC